MLVRHISELENPQLDPYRELKRTNLTRWSKWFIAEGKLVVERLLQSNFEIYSILLSEKRLDEFGPRIPDGLTTLVVSHEMCSQLVGFDFHAGVMACAVRPGKRSCAEFVPTADSPQTLIVCPNTTLPDNLGALLRIGAAFGASGFICGPETCDPFSRRTVRVSMGNVFQVPVFEPLNLSDELRLLRDRFGFEIVAANQSKRAERLPQFVRQRNLALVLGNEATGIQPDILKLCDREVEIPIASGVDSLNVSSAAAVLLYELTRPPRI
ncbi:MAG: RNA methyltransferase [Pirellulaceae bacterium]